MDTIFLVYSKLVYVTGSPDIWLGLVLPLYGSAEYRDTIASSATPLETASFLFVFLFPELFAVLAIEELYETWALRRQILQIPGWESLSMQQVFLIFKLGLISRDGGISPWILS
jgi:hypothetical protein